MSERIEGPIKCEVKANGSALIPCGPLKAALDDGRKGLLAAHVFSHETGFVLGGAQLHSGKFIKKGVFINFCPFCGVEIGELFDKRKQARAEAAS